MSYGPPGEQQPGNADELRGPTVLRMILGSQLRRLREAAGVTPDQAAWELRASRSKISRMEHGRVKFKDRDVQRTPEEIASFFDGLELVEPGVVSCPRWRPEDPAGDPPAELDAFGGVGRKA